MNIQILTFNPLEENTYILYDETKEAVIIDPGCFYEEEETILTNFIRSNKLKVKLLLNTHLHFDHILGNGFVAKTYGVKPMAHKDDEFFLTSLPAQLKMFGFPDMGPSPAIGQYLKENDIIEFGNQKLQILEIPGHSPGSIAFYNKDAKSVIVGDALFKSSIGRTDLAGGNLQQLLDSIQNKLFVLPPDTVVYSGHGASTTIGDEVEHNPFFTK